MADDVPWSSGIWASRPKASMQLRSSDPQNQMCPAIWCKCPSPSAKDPSTPVASGKPHSLMFRHLRLSRSSRSKKRVWICASRKSRICSWVATVSDRGWQVWSISDVWSELPAFQLWGSAAQSHTPVPGVEYRLPSPFWWVEPRCSPASSSLCLKFKHDGFHLLSAGLHRNLDHVM